MEVSAADIANIPARNLRVSRAEFVAVWIAAERDLDRRPDWYTTGVARTCRWLACATAKPATGPVMAPRAPVTEGLALAYEELIERECVEADLMLFSRPAHIWLTERPGWVEAVNATLNWAWRHVGPAPMRADVAAGA